MLSRRAKKQWKNQEYKKYMLEKYKEFYQNNKEYQEKLKKRLFEEQEKYWKNQENRKKVAERVKKFFKENPEAKDYLSNIAKEKWKDEALLIWRRQKTKEQWTSKFRKKSPQTGFYRYNGKPFTGTKT